MKIRFLLPCLIVGGGITIGLLLPSSNENKLSLRNEVGEDSHAAWDALQFLSQSQSFPFSDIPADGYQKAHEFYRQHFSHQSSTHARLAVSPWQNIGPNNIGGRTLGMAIDPVDTATIWLGSASGGLWKSTSGGIGQNAWTFVPTGYPVRGVSCIVINPNNPAIMYIGTGESYSHGTSVNGLITRPTRGSVGIGILKSTDGGISWSITGLNFTITQARTVNRILINPNNPNMLYAGASNGIYRSLDAGITWTKVSAASNIKDLELKPNDPTTVYAVSANSFYKSTNSGFVSSSVPSDDSVRNLPPPFFSVQAQSDLYRYTVSILIYML